MAENRAEELRAAVAEILSPYTIPPGAVDRICAAYGERWRAYHNESHILGMWKGARALDLNRHVVAPLGLLIVYHDVWLKIGREPGESERKSAQWAVTDLSCYPNPTYLPPLLQQGIEATITHTLGGVEERFARYVELLLDLDLWGLGQSPAYFRGNTEDIWHEYEPLYTRAEYDKGRGAWAASFLARPRIYHTPYFSHLEEQARENLRALV